MSFKLYILLSLFLFLFAAQVTKQQEKQARILQGYNRPDQDYPTNQSNATRFFPSIVITPITNLQTDTAIAFVTNANLTTIETYDFVWKLGDNSTDVFSTGTDSYAVRLKPNVLAEGTYYTVNLELCLKNDWYTMRNYTYSFETEQAPFNGSLVMEPMSGESCKLNYTISAINWVTEYKPLSYRFSYLPAGQTNTLNFNYLTDITTEQTITTTLPLTSLIRVEVFDSRNLTKVQTLPVDIYFSAFNYSEFVESDSSDPIKTVQVLIFF